MPHARKRLLEPLLVRSLKFWPVVCLIGARQVGKSTLLKQIPERRYLSLDDPSLADLVERNPKSILSPPCSIDEAQKSPRLFDAIKFDVDHEKRPGKYILTGSVRFSRRTLIRESLTGRAKTLQLFPFTCAEIEHLPMILRWEAPADVLETSRITRKWFERHLNRGGMPGIFAVRNDDEVRSYWKSLTESYVYRDLLLAIEKNSKPSIAFSILRAIAEILSLGDNATFARILKKTGGTRLMVQRHLQALEDMMIVHRLSLLGGSAQNDIFLPFDPAFFLSLLDAESATQDVAIHQACIQIVLLNEILAQSQYADHSPNVHYVLSSGGEMIHFVTQGPNKKLRFWKLFEESIPHHYELRALEGAVSKHEGEAFALTCTETPVQIGRVRILPWEAVL